jgi:hypothetical protein
LPWRHPRPPNGRPLSNAPSSGQIGRFNVGESSSFILFYFFLPDSLLFSSILLTSMRSCNEHAPLIIQEGRARAGQIPQPRRDGQSPDLDSSKHSKGEGGEIPLLRGGNIEVRCRTRKCMVSMASWLLFSSSTLTSMRSCNGHAHLIIQEGLH